MPPGVQSELARVQFVRVLVPPDLRVQVQFQHPSILQLALEMAVEREIAWGVVTEGGQRASSLAVRSVGMAQSPAEEGGRDYGTNNDRGPAGRSAPTNVSVGSAGNLDIWSEIALVPTQSRETP